MFPIFFLLFVIVKTDKNSISLEYFGFDGLGFGYGGGYEIHDKDGVIEGTGGSGGGIHNGNICFVIIIYNS
jgi:hypothetical protein